MHVGKRNESSYSPGHNMTIQDMYVNLHLPVLLTSGALSIPVLIDTAVQHWLLAIDRDCIAVGLSFESPPVRTI